MHLRSPQGELSLELLHATPSQSPAQPDLHVRVSARVSKFAAQDVRAWLEWPDVDAFVRELSVLTHQVRGEAQLNAMSPNDFELVVANLDSKGHFGLRFLVGSTVHGEYGQFECGLRGGFEVELSQIEDLLCWFRTAIQHGTDA